MADPNSLHDYNMTDNETTDNNLDYAQHATRGAENVFCFGPSSLRIWWLGCACAVVADAGGSAWSARGMLSGNGMCV